MSKVKDIAAWINGADYLTTATGITLNPWDQTVFCTNNTNITLTLPAAASALAGLTYTIKKTGNNANTVIIDGNASETIDGATTLVLYVLYDCVTIVCDGINWVIVADGRAPHCCRLARSTVQSIVQDSDVKILLNAEEYDVGGIGDPTTNNRIDILRTGRYMVTAAGSTEDSGAAVYNFLRLYKNGALVETGNYANADDVHSLGAWILTLTAGDYLELYIHQDSAGSANTITAASQRPNLAVAELR